MKKNRKKIFLLLVLIIAFTLCCSSALAQYRNQEKIPGGGGQTDSFPTYLRQIINFGFATIGILALFMIVIGAYQYLMAAGNIGKVESAKETIFSAIFGLILGLCAWIILFKINPDLVKMDLSNISNISSPSAAPTQSGAPGPNAGKCVEGTGDCSQENLSCFGDQAKNASIVCNAESGGSSKVGSGTDKCGGQSASWGLMQINVTCHNIDGLNCSGAVSCCYDGRSCDQSNCSVTNPIVFNQCVSAATDPQKNIQYACSLYGSQGFKPWGAAKKCGVI